MKKLKTLFVPLMACSLLVGCGNKQPDVPENPIFSVTESTVTYDSGTKQAKVNLNWTPEDHSITFSEFSFTYDGTTISKVGQTGGPDARPAEVTITFEEDLTNNITGGVLNFNYEDKTTKTEGKGKVEGININVAPIPPIPVVDEDGINLTYMRMNAANGSEVRFSYENPANDLKVYWGDGDVNNLNYHTYKKPGRYSIYITGEVDNIALVDVNGTMLARDNNNVEHIIFSNHVTKIDVNAFNFNSPNIRSAFIPETVESIGNNAISFHESVNAVYCLEDKRNDGCWAANCFLNLLDGAMVTGIKLHLGLDNILYATYTDSADATNNFAAVYICCDLTLKNASIANNIQISKDDETIIYPVAAIWDSAFYEMNTLESVEIPSNIEHIYGSAFIDCKNLKTITFSEDSKLNTIETYAFARTKILEISIPSTITRIDAYAFSECTQLTKVKFEDSDISSKEFTLEQYVFNACPNINELILGEGITKVEMYSIDGFAINKIVLPSTLKTAEQYSINNCESLTTIDASKFTSENIPEAKHFAFQFANPKSKISILMGSELNESNYTAKGWPTASDKFEYV